MSGNLMGRFVMEVVTVSGRAAAVEFRIGDDVVEVWFRDRRSGTFERGTLRDWLCAPGEDLRDDEAGFSLDRMVDRAGRVALSLPDVAVWTLAPEALAALRRQL